VPTTSPDHGLRIASSRPADRHSPATNIRMPRI
jgi:hypothetical protein